MSNLLCGRLRYNNMLPVRKLNIPLAMPEFTKDNAGLFPVNGIPFNLVSW